MPIISTAEYKTYRGITDSGWDTRLGVLIPMVQAHLERYCGRAFDQATYTDEAYDGNGERSLWLPHGPVTAVSAVKILDSEGGTTTLGSGDYRWTADGQLFRISGSYDSGWDYQTIMRTLGGRRSFVWPDDAPANILVTYTAGYAADGHPDDLKGLMYLLVDAALDEAGENFNLAASGDGVVSRTVLAPDLITRRFADLARPWRGVGLAVPR